MLAAHSCITRPVLFIRHSTTSSYNTREERYITRKKIIAAVSHIGVRACLFIRNGPPEALDSRQLNLTHPNMEFTI